MPNSPSEVAAGAPNTETYTDNGDGTITDTVTGLMWQKAVAMGAFTHSEAIAFCPTLNLGGHGDWRLPSRVELVSIVDYGQSNPSINTTYFPATPANLFWSSSPLSGPPGETSSGWHVFFDYGGVGFPPGSQSNFARCVRGGASATTMQYTTDVGTVNDTKTKLTWQRIVPTTSYTWADANTYCQQTVGASLGGTGWRLPTIKELQTIVDDSRLNPAIDPTTFPATPAAPLVEFWSSSPLAGSTSSAWFIGFYYGSPSNYGTVSDMHNVRCVR
jgi:Protein of unknown function (DUF1566)